MSRTARLESILAGGVLVAALAVVGTVPVDVPADDDVEWGPVVEEDQPPATTVPVPVPPAPRVGREQPAGGDDLERLPVPAPDGGAEAPAGGGTALRNADGSPTASNPGFFDALPGPSVAQGVPNFVIRKFRVPLFLLPIYQAAGIEYGVRWEVLAAINEIETDYGRNLNVSSAGALGWMQFMPSSWEAYGVDANKDGRKDPYNPVDAIFAYNHADCTSTPFSYALV